VIEQTATELAFDDSGKLALARGLGGADGATMSDAAPRMSAFSKRRRFSPGHVRARLAQIDAVLAQVDAWLDGAAAHGEGLCAALHENVWIAPDFVAQVAARLAAGEGAMRALRADLAATRHAFGELPLSETDDGVVPEPILS
jgi:MoxR-like ATPase